jgi:hypothetical protein
MRFARDTAAERIAARQRPEGSVERCYDAADAVVYLYAGSHGEVYAIGYAGTAYRPAFHFRFKDEARRSRHVDAWVAGLLAAIERRQARKAEKKASTHSLQLGDIVYASWGYEQTNIDFYQVVRVVSGKSVQVRHLRQTTDETGFMCGKTTTEKDCFTEAAPMLLCRAESERVLNIGSSRGSASKWDGRPLSCSWYA